MTDERGPDVKRWIVVDWENKVVMQEAYDTKREAWRATTDQAKKENRSPYEWDQIEIDVEAR